jgi:hypothetical protein
MTVPPAVEPLDGETEVMVVGMVSGAKRRMTMPLPPL